MSESKIHETVLAAEVENALGLDKIAHLKSQAKFIDATVGTGGHALSILEKGGSVLGIDLDHNMLEVAEKRLKACPVPKKIGNFYNLIQGNFIHIDEIASKDGFGEVNGIIFDLGVSNIHLTHPDLGFSFSNPEAALDMRLDPANQGVSAKDLLNVLNIGQLNELFCVSVNPRISRLLSQEIIEERAIKPFETVGDLLDVVYRLPKEGKLHPGTKVFLALRIAVNLELENLTLALPKALGLLTKGGRLAVISFHSGEDKIVKDFFGEVSGVKVLTDKPITPSEEERWANPRSRSAKLRVIEKL